MGNQLRLQIEKWWRKKRMIFCPMLVTRMWVSLLLVILLGNFFFLITQLHTFYECWSDEKPLPTYFKDLFGFIFMFFPWF